MRGKEIFFSDEFEIQGQGRFCSLRAFPSSRRRLVCEEGTRLRQPRMKFFFPPCITGVCIDSRVSFKEVKKAREDSELEIRDSRRRKWRWAWLSRELHL